MICRVDIMTTKKKKKFKNKAEAMKMIIQQMGSVNCPIQDAI